jgi:hypothetical protein
MEKYFDYEDIEEEKMVKHAVTRLKGHAALWWDEMQAERRRNGKKKIKNWDRMVAKVEIQIYPKGLPNQSLENITEPETEGFISKGVH